MLHDPVCDLLILGTSRHKSLQFICADPSSTEEALIQWTAVNVFALPTDECSPTFVDAARRFREAAQLLVRRTWCFLPQVPRKPPNGIKVFIHITLS